MQHSGSISILKIGMLDIRAPWITTDIGSKDVKDQSEEPKDEAKGMSSPDKQDNAESKIETPAAEVDHEKGKEKEHEREDKGKEKEEEGDDESADRSTIEEGAPAEEMSMQQEILNHLETKLFFWKDSKEMKMDDELYQKYSTRAAASFPNPVKCGTLTKQGKIHKTWRERYFVLEESILFYYDSPKSERPNGVIDLNGCEVLKDVTRGKKNCFQVSHTRKKETSRTFVFYAKTAEEMKSWISVLNAATRTRKPSNPRAVDPRRLSSQPRLRLPKDDTAAVGPLQERPASARPHQKARAKSFSSTQKVRPTVSAREFVAGAHRNSSMLPAGYEEEEGDVVTIVEEVSTPYVEPELEKETEKEKEKEQESEGEKKKEEEEEHNDKEGKEKEKEKGVSNENNEDGSWKEPEPREDVEPPKITFLTESKTEKNQLSEETIEKYMSLAEENEAKLLAQVEPHGSETKSWKLVKEIDNILVSKRDVSGSSHFLTRVEGRIRAPVDKIMSLIRTLEYDPLTISVTEVARVNENMDLSHLCMRAPSAIVSDRDFSVLRFKRRNTSTGGWVLCAVSVETELIPEDSSYVRGHVIHSGWVIEPFGTEGKESFCTYVLGLDPKGWAPIWLLNMFRTTNMFQSFTHLKAKCEAQPKKGSSS